MAERTQGAGTPGDKDERAAGERGKRKDQKGEGLGGPARTLPCVGEKAFEGKSNSAMPFRADTSVFDAVGPIV